MTPADPSPSRADLLAALAHLSLPFDTSARSLKRVAPISLPADLTPDALAYLATVSGRFLPRRASVRAYLLAWGKARAANLSPEEAHEKGRAAVRRSYALADAAHLVRTFRQAGIKFNK